MRKFIITIFLSIFASTIQADQHKKSQPTQNQLLLNMQIPCSEKAVKYISETVEEYGEQEFASGVIGIKPLSKPALETVDLLMYVNPKTRTFTLFTVQKIGEYEVACVLAGGIDFKPFSGQYRDEK